MITLQLLPKKKTMSKFSFTNPCMILCLSFYFASVTPAMSLSNVTDFEALVAFKNAIDIDPRGVLNSWNETVHFCTWGGVLCSQRHQGRVVSINLMSQGLSGSLPPHLGNLSFLRSIVLQNNSFHGQIPEEIGRLRRLEWIEFSNNSLGGEIPRNLSRCTNIYYLNLIDNNLTGTIIPELSSLLQLEALGLTDNQQLSGTIPPFIGNFTSLVLLSLANINLWGEIPESFVQLRNLQLLSLDGNRLTGRVPSGLYNISTISIFSMRSNLLLGTIPSDIGYTLPRLRQFDLGDNQFSGEIPVSFSNASLLERIYLPSNNFTGRFLIDFSRFQALESLIIASNLLDGDISFVSSLTNCTRLESLSLFGNLFAGSLPDSISNLSSRLNFLALGGNQLYGSIPYGIVNLLGLTRLDIANNDLDGPIPPAFGKLYKLQELYLGANNLTGVIPFSLGNLTMLNHLRLEQNSFFGNVPQSLGNCSNLLSLVISYNNLSGLIPREIMSLSSISISFDLGFNAFVGSIPVEVGSLTNLVNFDLSHNRLSGSIPDTLSRCIRLEQLHLESNSLTGEIPDRLSSLRGLQYLDLSQNNLSGRIPRFLSELDLVHLNLSFNRLQGEIPTLGVFLNESAISVEGNNELCGGVAFLELSRCPPIKKKQFPTVWKVLIPVAGAGAIIITLSACFYVFVYKKRTSNVQPSVHSFKAVFLRLSYADLLQATGGFSEANLLGAGKFGAVYKGVLDGGETLVAVKVLNLNTRGASKSFLSECNALSGIRHRNLIKLLSVCESTDFRGNEFKALVYEYMANGNLDEWLHKKSEDETSNVQESRNLSLKQRLNIAVDIASALEYLHSGTDSTIVHGDLKPSNILLDDQMTARVGDFGLAKFVPTTLSTQESSSIAIKGTIGYIPPEYGMSGVVSEEGDVYSYGILLLEMFTGKRPTDEALSCDASLRDIVESALSSEVMEVVDHVLLDEHELKMDEKIKTCIVSVLEIGVACSSESPRDRMAMADVVTKLYKSASAVE